MAKEKPFFVKPLPFTIAQDTGSETDHPASHAAELDAPSMTLKYDFGVAGSKLFEGDLGANAPEVDFVSVISASALTGSGTEVQFRMNDVDDDWSNPNYNTGNVDFMPTAETPPSPKDGLYHWFHEFTSAHTDRYFRLYFPTHTGELEIAAVVIGKKVEFPFFYNRGWEHEVEDLGDIDFGRWGINNVKDGLIYRRLAMTLGWTTFAKYEEEFQPLMESLGRRNMIYCCFDPEAVPKRQQNCYLGWMHRNPVARGGRTPGYYEQDFDIMSLI